MSGVAVRAQRADAAGSLLFFALMAVGSGISLARGFAVAGFLEPAAFGVYVTVVAAGTFASNLLSFGRIEATMKEYPRLWVAGQRAMVMTRVDAVARVLALRAAAATVVAALAVVLFGASQLLTHVVLGAGVALGVAASSLYASAQRATYDLRHLGFVTVYRAVLAFVLAALGAYVGAWRGALLGEITAAFLSVMASRYLLGTAVKLAGSPPEEAPAEPAVSRVDGGVWLFAGFLLASVPLYLDRLFVATVFSPEQVGTYGFVMLFVSGATVVVGIISQKVGPRLVRDEHRGASLGSHVRLVALWGGGFAAACAAGMAAIAWVLLDGPAADLGRRYQLDKTLLTVVFMLCCAQCSTLLDWILLSRDRERDVFVSSALFLLAACCAGASTVILSLGLAGLLSALTVAKLVQLALQAWFIATRPKGSPSAGRL